MAENRGLLDFLDVVTTVEAQQQDQFDGIFKTGQSMRDAIVATDAVESQLATNDATLAEQLRLRDESDFERDKLGLTAPFDLQKAALDSEAGLLSSQSLLAQAQIDRENDVRYEVVQRELGTYMSAIGWGTEGGYSPESYANLPLTAMDEIVRKAKDADISGSSYNELTQGLDLKALTLYEAMGADNFNRIARMSKEQRELTLRDSRFESRSFEIIASSVERLKGQPVEINRTSIPLDNDVRFNENAFRARYMAGNGGEAPSEADVSQARLNWENLNTQANTPQSVSTRLDSGGDQIISPIGDMIKVPPADVPQSVSTRLDSGGDQIIPAKGVTSVFPPAVIAEDGRAMVKVVIADDGALYSVSPDGARLPFNSSSQRVQERSLVLPEYVEKAIDSLDTTSVTDVMVLSDVLAPALKSALAAAEGDVGSLEAVLQNRNVASKMTDMLDRKGRFEAKLTSAGVISNHVEFADKFNAVRDRVNEGRSWWQFGDSANLVNELLSDPEMVNFILTVKAPSSNAPLVTLGEIQNHLDGTRLMTNTQLGFLKTQVPRMASQPEYFYDMLDRHINPNR